MKPIYYYVSCLCLLVLLQIPPSEVIGQQGKIAVTGSVLDSLGRHLEGVSVRSKMTAGRETKTDQNGKFILEVEERNDVIVFSFVGYATQEMPISQDGRELVVRLVESGEDIEEVVVTAFGQRQRREAVVGSVSSVKPGDLKIPASNLTNALAGQIAGVIGFQRSGQPGQDNSQFFIRGVTTFGYRQEPLILIDNVELSTNDLARLN